MTTAPPQLWPHQVRGVEETLEAAAHGERRILLCSPTGGGKSRMACELIDRWAQRHYRVAVYTNRRMLVDQLSHVLGKHGIGHGSRAAGWEDEREFDVQICTPQTEESRVYKKGLWKLHDAEAVIVDEAHLQKGEVMRKIMAAHEKAGAVLVGLTATPIDLGGDYSCLVVAGTNSELRGCGALVPCWHYGPDEPDLRKIGKVRLGEDLSEAQDRKAIMVEGIFGRVLEWFDKLNPQRRPTILFAPGVKESVWFAQQFQAAGVSAAHIDGKECWVGGEWYANDFRVRQQILEGSKGGRFTVLCNRFVLREGVDCPWLAHGIFATVFGSLQSYLQSGGRLLRAWPGLDSVTVQDHGGNWHRHGSLNADRDWQLGLTSAMAAGTREEALRQKQLAEPARCPECARILYGTRCPCGYRLELGKKSRPVVQADGTLKEYRGDIYRPRRITKNPDAGKLWQRMYHRARRAGMTFAQARALFAVENHWGYPPPDLPLMPTVPKDWYLKVADVPAERLSG